MDYSKPQGPSGNKVVVSRIDVNGLGVMKGGLVGPVDNIHVVNCDVNCMFRWNVLDALLVGMYEVEAIIWEVEGPILLNEIDVNCEVTTTTIMEEIIEGLCGPINV